MTKNNSILLLAILILCGTNYAAAQNDATGPAVMDKACSKATNKILCMSVLSASPDSQSANLKSLAFIALKAASMNATEASAQIKMLMDNRTLETPVSDSLITCSQQYLDVVNQIDDSVNALVSDAYDDVDTWVQAAIDDIKTCDNLVNGRGGKEGLVSVKNQIVTQLCSNALSVVKVVIEK